MRQLNSKVLKIVAGLHVGVALIFVFQGCVTHLFTPKPDLIVPIEFLVDVTPPMPDMGGKDSLIPEPEPAPSPIPEPIQEPPKPEAPKPEPPKPEAPKEKPPKRVIEVSQTRVIRKTDAPAPHHNPLTEAEIRKLLAMGATASNRTSIPDEDSRCLAVIKTTLDTLWQKPVKEAAGDAEAVLRLWIESDGSVKKAELSRTSGNSELDASVEEVGRQVRRIHGLTPDFINRRSPVTVAFKVQ